MFKKCQANNFINPNEIRKKQASSFIQVEKYFIIFHSFSQDEIS